MSDWWILDDTGHKRGPLKAKSIGLLLHIGSLKDSTPVFCEGLPSWMTVSTCEILKDELSNLLFMGDQSSTSVRLSMSEIPPMETLPCQDSACPFAPSCDVVYIWDRETECWLTFDEYVSVCRESGLFDGLPDRVLAGSSDQIQALLLETDLSRLGRKKPLDDDEPLSDPEKEAKRQKRRAYRERKKLRRDAGEWLKSDKTNPNIYVSSLPLEITETELEALFKQAGLLKEDLSTGKPRIKLYGHGDALITYMHTESVPLAIDRFHEYEISPGCRICVQPADFNISTVPLSREELEERAEQNRETRRKKLDLARKDRRLKSAWESTGKLPILVFHSTQAFDHEYTEQLLTLMCAKFGEVKVKSLPQYMCVKFGTLADAESCLLTLQNPTELNGVSFSVFLHDGRDLSSIEGRDLPLTSVAGQDADWESFLNNEDSDDEDIQIRTE